MAIMKVAVISMFREGYGGGGGRVAHDMARQFSPRHQVVLICPSDRTRRYVDQNGLRVLGIRSTGQGHACVPRLSRRDVNALFDLLDQFQPDVIHAHEPVSLGLMGQVWAAMNDVPFVYTSHVLPSKTLDFGASHVFEFLPSSFTQTMSRRMMSDFMNNCDAVIALNQPAADDIRAFGYRGTVLTIPNGRDVERLGACPAANVHTPIKTLTFVGFISQRKNQAYLIEVMNQLPRDAYRLQIIGDVLEPDYASQIVAQAQAHGLQNIVFAGPVPHAEIPDYLDQTHVFVSASKMEVQSLSVIEALASGTPVVGLANETIDELVDERVGCRLGQDAGPATFAHRVDEICALPQPAYDLLCHHARRRVEHLDWHQIERDTVAAYAQLVGQRHEHKSDAQIARIIERIPSEKVQEILIERLVRLNQTLLAKIHPRSRLDLFARVAYANQISRTTWFYVGLTRFVSSFLGKLSQHTAAYLAGTDGGLS
jgi:glycosyltransferase involved in cell wall biosynthesis